MKYMCKVLVAGLFGLALFTFNVAAADQAPVPKSGTATFSNPGHWHSVNYKTAEKGHGGSGEWRGMIIPKSDQKFLRYADWQSVFGEQSNDEEKGVQVRIERGQILDGDKDAVFTSSNCRLNSWSDWCVGVLEGGTGKYSGISGTIKWAFDPESSYFLLSSAGGAPSLKSRYETSGEISLLVEISWKLP